MTQLPDDYCAPIRASLSKRAMAAGVPWTYALLLGSFAWASVVSYGNPWLLVPIGGLYGLARYLFKSDPELDRVAMENRSGKMDV